MKPNAFIVLSPFEFPDANLVLAACRAGAVGVLDLGSEWNAASEALRLLANAPKDRLGVRIPWGLEVDPDQLPPNVGTIVVPAGVPLDRWVAFRKLVQVTSVEEALEAQAQGADGIIAKGFESGGRVGEETLFVLLQHLAGQLSIPIWAQGGVGLYTAAACFAGGAAGVVLDSQLALVRESTLPEEVKSVVRAMDGSETVVVEGHRVYSRPDLPIARLAESGVAEKLGARDLSMDLLPAGADAAFAKALADAFQTVGGVIRAIRENVRRQVRSAQTANPLARKSRFASRYGLRYPIVQGPMTRVSDVAPFAKAVADGGGLPFLALAVMRGPEVRALLSETAALLKEQAWGVGVLGFAPPELREEQLAAIREVKPPIALIAGGRPSQARPLEDAGIPTFLHVPSPGLLDMFLSQGARRFVFEGLECGGHVGPRSSFVLWESQMQRLLHHTKPQELSVLFAGGIHDARSAAMVAAMASSLAERGVEVGVLMGTAYVFTEEAVRFGAIRPAFQKTALTCDRTVLLETAPGHSTRCVESPYVSTFQAERERMRREGMPAEDMWVELETLNLGRLRIASKGLRREGNEIVEVDTETQRREGMVMIGQVAALQDSVRTIEELHANVSEGSATLLSELELEDERETHQSSDVAIVGMAAVMPGAPDLETFWANIVNGVNSIREVPRERWNADLYYDPASMNGEKTPSKWGGFLDPVPFDPLEYGIPPLSLSAIEPVQLLALEVSRRALADAGYVDRDFDREHTSVIFGAEAGTDLAGAYGFRALWRQYAGDLPPELDEVLPSLTEDSFPGILANVIAGRVANRLDLGGSNYTVDAACASSLAAVDLACKELTGGTSEMVICGGADLHNGIVDYLAFASVHALSPSGQSKTFDSSADGITLGEGVAAIVLKRLEDAERDNDRVYAVIKGVGSSSDGRSLGLTAPRPQGEERALERAYAHAGVSPAEVGLIEAHGTGTVVGDRTELETLTTVFSRAGAAPGSCALGSVKSQIGHTKCAAGLAGLIKAALALHHRVLPPTLNIEEPNAAWSPESPFSLNTSARPWPGWQRKAGVSAFGFGGTNYHTVLASYDPLEAKAGFLPWPAELFLFRGARLEDALQAVDSLANVLTRDEPWRLRDLARTVSADDAAVQIAIVAKDEDDLKAKLQAVRTSTQMEGVFVKRQAGLASTGKLAFLFPGQGSQRPGMLRDLFIAFPELQRYLDRGRRWAGRIFPPTVWTEEERSAQRAELTDTRVAQPALGVGGLAVFHLLEKLGVKPDMFAGHSYGELVALTAAGAIAEDDLLELSESRAHCILDATASKGDSGTMAAVSADAKTAFGLIANFEGVVIANENAPDQTVISGSTDAVNAAVRQMKAAGLSVASIPVACAFHSPLVAKARPSFRARLDAVSISQPALPVFSNTTAQSYPKDADAIRDMLAEQIVRPVRFASEIEAMYEAGARTFVEVGPGRVLTGLVSRILGDRPHLAVACDQPASQGGIPQLLTTLARLAIEGVELNVDALYEGREARVLDLSQRSALLPSNSSWWVNGQRAWPLRGEPPSHALKPVTGPVVHGQASNGHKPTAASGREAIVLDYMRTVRESLEGMRNVVGDYLGSDGAVSALTETLPLGLEAQPQRAESQGESSAPVPESGESLTVAEEREPAAPEIDIEKLLLAIVSERTGYPPEMLGLDLDLEADLSIDSIKRIEILGALTSRLGISVEDALDELPEDLVRIKSLRGIIAALSDWAEDAMSVGTQPQEIIAYDHDVSAIQPTTPESKESQSSQTQAVGRYVLALSPTGSLAPPDGVLAGKTVAIRGNGSPIIDHVIKRLMLLGSEVNSASVTGDAFVELTALQEGWSEDKLLPLFQEIRLALAADVKVLLIVTRLGDAQSHSRNGHSLPSGAGLAGMVKSFAKERPDCSFRIVNLSDDIRAEDAAVRICNELTTIEDIVEVSYLDGVRRMPRPIRMDLNKSAVPHLGLDEESVILLTGGARGITAEVAVALAKRFHCRFELVGRTQLLDSDAYPTVDDGTDRVSVRRQLIAAGMTDPAQIEATSLAIVASKEVRETLQAIEAAGGQAIYHALDLRDTEQFGRLIEEVYSRCGRLDGVIHGAGVIQDSLAIDKSPESFERVLRTKVGGALALVERTHNDLKFLAFFSSVSGVFGNRGQTDYAAANAFLDQLALSLNQRHPGRIVSINWGPWSGAGMVSPELAREYSRRGIALIEPSAGAESLISELLYGPECDAQVILTAADPARFS